MQAKIEDRLQRELNSDTSPDKFLDVVVSFDVRSLSEQEASTAPKSASASFMVDRARRSALMEQFIESALQRVGELAGETPEVLSQQPLLGSAVVKAHRGYFKALLQHPALKGAVLNTAPGTPKSKSM